jgi:glycosyltransferase involved in cell wall biosynthesis
VGLTKNKTKKRLVRVLLWAPFGSGLHYGGAGTNAYRMYSAAPEGTIELTLVHGCPDQEDYPLFAEQVFMGPISPLTVKNQIRFLSKAKAWLKANHRRFDVLHGLDVYDATVLPAYWADRLGLPAFVKPAAHASGLMPAKGLRGILRRPQKRRRLLGEVTGIVAISSAIRDELLGYGIRPEMIHPISNGVDTELFHPPQPDEKLALRKKMGWDPDAFVLLFVGAVCSRKRPGWMIEALPALMEANRGFRLAIVGPERETGHLVHLESLAKELGVAEAIHWYGHTDVVHEFYRAADAFCLPSKKEGMPNAALEALVSGLPCLLTPISGSADLLAEEGGGWAIESAADIERICGDLMAGRTALDSAKVERLREKYGACAILQKHLDLFRGAL